MPEPDSSGEQTQQGDETPLNPRRCEHYQKTYYTDEGWRGHQSACPLHGDNNGRLPPETIDETVLDTLTAAVTGTTTEWLTASELAARLGEDYNARRVGKALHALERQGRVARLSRTSRNLWQPRPQPGTGDSAEVAD